MIVLSILGLIAAIWVWNNVHWAAGLIVGFLFVGGAGWKLLGAAATAATPSGRSAFGPEGKQFTRAWEQRFGEMRPGRHDNLPPPEAFKQWLEEYRRSGISAGDWIDSKTGRPTTAQVNRANASGSVTGVCNLYGSILTDPDYPEMRLVVDQRGMAIHNMSGAEFFSIEWDSVRTVEQRDDGKCWIEFRSVGGAIDSLLSTFQGMAVLQVDNPDRFATLLVEHGPNAQRQSAPVDPEKVGAVRGRGVLEVGIGRDDPIREFVCDQHGFAIANPDGSPFITVAWDSVRDVERDRRPGQWWVTFQRRGAPEDETLDDYWGFRIHEVEDADHFAAVVNASGSSRL